MSVDPVTPREWQDAVDGAYAALCLESARRYGLVTGGPRVHVERCEQILHRGRELGYRPRPDAVERFAAAIAAWVGGETTGASDG